MKGFWRAAVRSLRDGWLVLGISLVLFLGLEAAYRGQAELRRWARSGDGGGSLHPYADSSWYSDYTREYRGATDMDWRSYVYFRRSPFEGRVISVDSSGHRSTVSRSSDPADGEIFFFGGSTMWGDYQRNEFTIPSVVGTYLDSARVHPRLVNFGESGYVMTQGMLELLIQLRRGQRPDVVVFYDGLNDVAAAVQSGLAGIPQNESNREREFELGRAVRGWEADRGIVGDLRALGMLTLTATERSQLLQRLLLAIGDDDVPFTEAETAAAVVEVYRENVRIVEALAEEFGFRALYVWQPSPHVSRKALTRYEERVLRPLRGDSFHSELRRVHQEVVQMLPSELADESLSGGFMDLSDVFDGHEGSVWVDLIGHTTEEAAAIVAREIAKRIQPWLE